MILLTQIKELMLGGGIMMWPLLVMNFILWFALTMRARLLYGEQVEQELAQLNDKASPSVVTLHNLRFLSRLKTGRSLIQTVVTAAPLMGLLGTVMGMIETFESLGEMSLFTQSGGIAGGISQALITTQMGLAVAIPGLLIGRTLVKKEMELESEAQARSCLAAITPSGE